MKNLGIFSPSVVDHSELAQFGSALGGISIGDSTLRFGSHPNEAYLEIDASLNNGCFDNEEFRTLQNDLGFPPVSYISVHMNYSQEAYLLALKIARAIQEKWGGQVDYSGAGGGLGTDFEAGGVEDSLSR